MGQATLDLPDPSQLSGFDTGPLSPEALASADDLLSQLAGEDIDRLLAEAETERPSAPPTAPESEAAVPPPVDQPAAVEPIAQVLGVEPPPAQPSPAEPPAAEATVESTGAHSPSPTDAAIEAVLAPALEFKIEGTEPPPAAPPATPTAAESALETAAVADAGRAQDHAVESPDQKVLDEAAAHVAAIMDPPAVEPEHATAALAAERQALSEPLVVPTAVSKPSAPLSLLVKFLQLINWPMTLVSDNVREAMGKVAILTMFNAAAVLVYVLVFRRPHH